MKHKGNIFGKNGGYCFSKVLVIELWGISVQLWDMMINGVTTDQHLACHSLYLLFPCAADRSLHGNICFPFDHVFMEAGNLPGGNSQTWGKVNMTQNMRREATPGHGCVLVRQVCKEQKILPPTQQPWTRLRELQLSARHKRCVKH